MGGKEGNFVGWFDKSINSAIIRSSQPKWAVKCFLTLSEKLYEKIILFIIFIILIKKNTFLIEKLD